jgi:hypothetical protein
MIAIGFTAEKHQSIRRKTPIWHKSLTKSVPYSCMSTSRHERDSMSHHWWHQVLIVYRQMHCEFESRSDKVYSYNIMW